MFLTEGLWAGIHTPRKSFLRKAKNGSQQGKISFKEAQRLLGGPDVEAGVRSIP